MIRLLFFFILLIVLIIGVYFGMLNAHIVPVDYFFAETQLPLSLLMLMFLVVGSMLGLLVRLGSLLRLKLELAKLRRQLKQHQEKDNLIVDKTSA